MRTRFDYLPQEGKWQCTLRDSTTGLRVAVGTGADKPAAFEDAMSKVPG